MTLGGSVVSSQTPILTQLVVKNAKPRGRRYELPDGARAGGLAGFALRVGEHGAKSYVLRYRVGGQQRRVTIGNVAVLTLAEARARARVLVDQAKQGIDPAAAKVEQRVHAQNTVRAIVAEYLERHVRRNLRSAGWIERQLQREVVAAWGDRQIRSIATADVIRLVNGIDDRGAGVMANRILQLLGRLFAWAIGQKVIDANPAAGIKLLHKEKSRDRVLDDRELAGVWRASSELAWPWSPFVRLAILLGQRRSEIAAMRWQDLDLATGVWQMPAEATKMARSRVLPLPGAAVALLEGLPRVENAGDYVFPGGAGGPISAFSGMKRDLDRLSGVRGWTLHDLRRTFATGQQRLGARLEVTEQLLGHVSGSRAGVVGVYQRHRYEPEQRVALEMWAEHVAEIVAGRQPKVVAFAAAAR